MQNMWEEFLWSKVKEKQDKTIFDAIHTNWTGNGNTEGKEIVKLWAVFYQELQCDVL